MIDGCTTLCYDRTRAGRFQQCTSIKVRSGNVLQDDPKPASKLKVDVTHEQYIPIKASTGRLQPD
jgi:hypothetical protein